MDISKYLDWGVASSPGFLRDWVGDDSLSAVWAGGLRELIARQVESTNFAKEYAEQCPCPTATLEDYRPRTINIGEGLDVLAGIHFGKEFFVNIYAQSRLVDTNDLRGAMDHIIDEFSMFEPVGVRWWFCADNEPRLAQARRLAETRLVVGYLPELACGALQANGDLVVELAPDLSVYDDYVAMYERYFSAYPQMRGVIRIEKRDALGRCAKQEALF